MDTQNNNNALTIPAAIVVAGVIIAGAVIYTNRTTNPASQQAAANGGAQEIQVAPVTSTDHIRGNPDAKLILVEYSDLECPFCKTFHSTMQAVMDQYGKDSQVAWVYRHFPLDPIHPKARKEAEATECATELGGPEMFWKYVDRIFAITPSNNNLDPQKLIDSAVELGLDKAAFTSCLGSGRYAGKVESDYQDGIKAGVEGTPHTIILTRDGNKIPIVGAQPITSLKSAIDQLLMATQ